MCLKLETHESSSADMCHFLFSSKLSVVVCSHPTAKDKYMYEI